MVLTICETELHADGWKNTALYEELATPITVVGVARLYSCVLELVVTLALTHTK